jgi:ABC-type amino acid transport substrate-binding protein
MVGVIVSARIAYSSAGDCGKTRPIGMGLIKRRVIPVQRDQLLPGISAGKGVIAAANPTVTSERKKMVDFSANRVDVAYRSERLGSAMIG